MSIDAQWPGVWTENYNFFDRFMHFRPCKAKFGPCNRSKLIQRLYANYSTVEQQLPGGSSSMIRFAVGIHQYVRVEKTVSVHCVSITWFDSSFDSRFDCWRPNKLRS